MPETVPQPETSNPKAPAWGDAELDTLHENSDKHEKVRAMFNAIARSYDINNRVHSLWRDQAWRRRCVREARVQPADHILDCACGTGDLSQAFARDARPARVVGTDYTPNMLDIARHKRGQLDTKMSGLIEYQQADAQDLPFDDGTFDVVSIAFGIRNVQDPDKAMGEFFRVLRPGGRLMILEFGQPSFPPMRWFNSFYCGTIMPRTATWIARDTSGAYKYLPRSVTSFKTRDEMHAAYRQTGFTDIWSKPLTMGICNLYRALKPA